MFPDWYRIVHYLCELHRFNVIDIVRHDQSPSKNVEFDSPPRLVEQLARIFKESVLTHMPNELVQDVRA